ncbi:peptidoglycan DD-metalloendopeptidase family protein [Ferdinandcohnia sp. Marseille-Q9671]
MFVFVRRITIVALFAACIGILFIGSLSASAQDVPVTGTDEEWAWPVLGRITDTFGTRQGNHKGLDIAAPIGDHIYAVDEGIVKGSYFKGSYGHVVFIEHPNGYETVYAHLSKRNVQEGQKVEKGQIIGHIGSTGNSTGPHLHFEVHNGEWNASRNNAIDPLFVLTNEQILVPTLLEKEQIEVSKKVEEKVTRGFNYNKEQENHIEAATVENKGNTVSKITVKKGDTLWDLSIRHNVSVESIMKWNNLNSSRLEVGKTLDIYHNDSKTYTVKEGDSLSVIASKVGLTVEEIKVLNHLQSDLIFPHQELIIEKS